MRLRPQKSCSSRSRSLSRLPLDPPPSQAGRSLAVPAHLSLPIWSHHDRGEATARCAVSRDMPTLTQPSSAPTSRAP